MASKKEVVINEDNLLCSICLEVYRRPRTLPCLHSFCHECLVGYVSKFLHKTEFPCPLCRTETRAGEPIDNVEKWVETYPVNFTLLSILENKTERMPCQENMCQPCLRDRPSVEKTAVVYCTECREILCEQCKTFHQKIKSSMDHKICDLTEAPSDAALSLLKKLTACVNHASETAVFLCKDHNILCCNECAFLSHRKCDDLDSLGNLTPATASDQETLQCSDLKRTLDKYEEHATQLIKHEANQSRLVDDSEKDITNQLTHLRKALDDTYMKIEHKVKRDFEDEKQKILKGVSVQTEAVDMFKSEVKAIQEEIEIVRKHGTTTHAYLLERSLTQDKMQYFKSEMEKLHACATDKVVALTETNAIEELMEPVLKSVQISTTKREISLPICPVEKSFNKREPMLLGSVDLADKTLCETFYPESCVWLGEYVAAAVRAHNVLKLIDQRTYTIVDTYKCSSDPWSVSAHENDNTVAVCFTQDKKIDIIDIGDCKLKYKFTLKMKNKPTCSYFNTKERKTFALSREAGAIDMFDTNGEHVGSVPLETSAIGAVKGAYKFTLDQRQNVMFISSYDSNRLLAVNMNGKVLFTYQNTNLIYPDGCDIDSEGSVYVCSVNGNSIHQVSKTGEHMRVLLKDKLKKPSCVSFNSTFDKCVVIDLSVGNHLKFYSFH